MAIILGLLAVSACAKQPEIIRRSSAPAQPKWTQSVPRDSEYLYFVGAKSGAPSLEDGRAAALAVALGQASSFIGVSVQAGETVVDSTVAHENLVRSDVRSQTAGELRSAEIADTYFESMSRVVGSGVFERFDVWVLLRFPRAEAERERSRQEEALRSEAEAAQRRFLAARQAQERNDWALAVRLLNESNTRLAPLAGKRVALEGEFISTAELADAVIRELAHSRRESRRSVVVFSEELLGRPSTAAIGAGAIAEALGNHGFVVSTPETGDTEGDRAALALAKGRGARLALVVSAKVARTGTVLGSHASCTASLSVRALDVLSGEVLARAEGQGRGIKADVGVAASEALREAGFAAADKLLGSLLAREQGM